MNVNLNIKQKYGIWHTRGAPFAYTFIPLTLSTDFFLCVTVVGIRLLCEQLYVHLLSEEKYY